MRDRDRPYIRSRRARFPSIWPMWLIGVAIIVPLNLFVVPHTLLADLGVSGLVAVSVAFGRIAIWRRRHPIISPEEYVDDMRRQAPWN